MYKQTDQIEPCRKEQRVGECESEDANSGHEKSYSFYSLY